MKRAVIGLVVLAVAIAVGLFAARRFRGRTVRSSSPTAPKVAEALLINDPAPLGLSPNGNDVLLLSLRDDRFRIILRSRTSGSERVLDDSPRVQRGVTFSPDGRMLAFSIDGVGNDERYEVFLLSIETGTRRAIATAAGRLARLTWTPNGDRLAMLAVGEKARQRDLLVHDLKSARTTTLATEISRRSFISWSTDGESLAFVLDQSPHAITTIDVRTGKLTHSSFLPEARILSATWARDDASLLVSAIAPEEERAAIYSWDRASAKATRVTPSQDADFTSPHPIPDGSGFFAARSSDGGTRLVRCPLGGATCKDVGPRDGAAGGTRFSLDGKSYFFLYTGERSATTLHALDLATDETRLIYASLADDKLLGVKPERVDLKSANQLVVPTYVWRTPSAPPEGAHALIRIHGEELHWGRAWDSTRELFLRHGFHVVDPNYRGSTGYGLTFEQAQHDVPRQREDLAAACAYVRDTLGVPKERITLWAGSYGTKLAPSLATSSACPCDTLVGLALLEGGTAFDVDPAKRAHVPRHVLAYQGHFDRLSPPIARTRWEERLGLPKAGVDYRFELLPDEGHAFAKNSTWTKILSDVLDAR